MRLIILILISILTLRSYSQRNILVVDSLTKAPLRFTNIDFLDSKGGTYSNDNGIFEVPDSVTRVKISHIGYKSKIINSINDTLFLIQKENELSEILITTKDKFIAGRKKSKYNIGFNSSSKSIILAKKLILENDSKIDEVHFDIINNKKIKKSRLLIFNIDENEMPYENILNEEVVKQIEVGIKTFTIDLFEFSVYLKKGIYFVALEIFNLNDENGKSGLKIGCYKSNNLNNSLFKPVFNADNKWNSIKTENKKKEYSFNFYISAER
ncbi:MAG: hypothetical protein R6V36_00035 [Psychroflexus sp.]